VKIFQIVADSKNNFRKLVDLERLKGMARLAMEVQLKFSSLVRKQVRKGRMQGRKEKTGQCHEESGMMVHIQT
jgi:hypothetical protein